MIRTKADLEAVKRGCYFSDTHAQNIITFANSVFRPQYIGGKFALLPWQVDFLRYLYGWRSEDHTRRFRTACLHIAKKNGKTLLCSIISTYDLLQSEEQSPFVVTGSVSKENAGQVFSELRHTLNKTFGKQVATWCRITPNMKRVIIPKLNAEYKALASDGDRVQGFNCSLVILDECHAHKNASLYDSLRYATAARQNGLMVIISTAGDDVSQWYHGFYQKAKRILSGDDLDTTFAAFVFEADANGNLDDVEQWRKANPSLGVSFSEDSFRLDLEGSRKDASELARFKRYRLNVWCRSDESAYFDAGKLIEAPRTDDELRNRPCWLGADLSMTTDPSSVSAVWLLADGSYYVRSWAWVARQGVMLRERSTMPRYNQFAAEGTMTITEGDMIDQDKITRFVIDLFRRYRVKSIVFDQTSAFGMMSQLQQVGMTVYTQSQTARYFSGPMKGFNKAMMEGRVSYDGSSWLRYCLSNVRTEEDKDGNIRPNTKGSLDHIDGAIALLQAFSKAGEQSPTTLTTPYDKRGVTFF